MSFSKEELEEFKAEALELLEVAEKGLLALDGGAAFQEKFDSIFRSFHNLKGAAGMMDLFKLQAYTHELESKLMSLKSSTSMPKIYIDFFLKGIDGARSLLDGDEIDFNYNPGVEEPAAEASVDEQAASEGAESTSSVTEIENALDVVEPAAPATSEEASEMQVALNEFTSECDEIIERVSSQLRIIEKGEHSIETLNDVYRDVHSLKGGSFLFGYTSLGNVAHALESAMQPIRDNSHLPTKELINIIYKCLNYIEQGVVHIKEKTKNQQSKTLEAELISQLNQEAGKLPVIIAPEIVVQSKGNHQMDSKEAPPKATEEVKPAAGAPASSEADMGGSIRVPVSLLDNLMNLMGEMVLVRNQVLQFSSKSEDMEFLNLSKRLNVVTNEIQGETMKTRMQPIGNILSKFHRVVRDLSNDLKKNITLTLVGAETELDKSLLEAIKDPLTHIVRNSCDHGIETPKTRKDAGKPEEGHITIKSYHEGGQVVMEITDDGKGLHREALIKKALEKGLINSSQAESLSEKEVYNLIFAPGFSTAAAITNVSGRGVGMDVVRTNIEKIGGTVELDSTFGKGTTIKIKIPLTLAIVPALIVRCGPGSFAIPQVKLEELVRVDQSSPENRIEYLQGVPVYRLRGNILPLVDLNKILGFETRELNSVTNIAVLNADRCSFGLIVDEIQDTADIVVKPLNRLLKLLQVYAGATILGDGSIALILDVSGISKVSQIGLEDKKSDSKNELAHSDVRKFDLQEFLVLKVNSPTKHAIVLNYVHRLEEFNRSDVELSGDQRLIRYGDSILPLISVSEQLGYSANLDAEQKDVIPVVVIEKGGILYGLEVDAIIDTLSIDVDIETHFVKRAGIFGNLNTPEELIVTIDPFEIINLVYPNSKIKPVVNQEFTSAHSTGSSKNPYNTDNTNRKLNVLLVEDTVFFRRAVLKLLEDLGHKVSLANDGREALEILKRDKSAFDLIVSDIEMPRMNGFELAQAIRSDKSLSHLPLLALSSRTDKGHLEKGIQSGFNMYVEKLNPDVLTDAISSIINSERKVA